MLEEFKKFIMRGNVVDLAVGVIIKWSGKSTHRFAITDLSKRREVIGSLAQIAKTPNRENVIASKMSLSDTATPHCQQTSSDCRPSMRTNQSEEICNEDGSVGALCAYLCGERRPGGNCHLLRQRILGTTNGIWGEVQSERYDRCAPDAPLWNSGSSYELA
jgi:hypothetical protein